MVTPNRFTAYLGGALVASVWSLHSAQQKLEDAILAYQGPFPAPASITDGLGNVVYSENVQDFRNLFFTSEPI